MIAKPRRTKTPATPYRNDAERRSSIVPAHTLAPWVGLGIFAAYAFAAIAGAAVLLVRRDA
jgi:hypothetical protein